MHAGHNSRVLNLPYRGASQTVGIIISDALAAQNDYAVRELAEQICVGLPSKAYLDEYLAIYYFVLTHTRYMRDPRTVELVRKPSKIARQILEGRIPSLDCDDMASLLCALVLAVGGQAMVCTVAFRRMYYQGELQYSHVFAAGIEPNTNRSIILDPVAAHNTKQMLRRVKAAKIWPVA